MFNINFPGGSQQELEWSLNMLLIGWDKWTARGFTPFFCANLVVCFGGNWFFFGWNWLKTVMPNQSPAQHLEQQHASNNQQQHISEPFSWILLSKNFLPIITFFTWVHGPQLRFQLLTNQGFFCHLTYSNTGTGSLQRPQKRRGPSFSEVPRYECTSSKESFGAFRYTRYACWISRQLFWVDGVVGSSPSNKSISSERIFEGIKTASFFPTKTC